MNYDLDEDDLYDNEAQWIASGYDPYRTRMKKGWAIIGHLKGRPIYYAKAEVSDWVKSQDKKHWQLIYDADTDTHFQFTDEFTTMFLLRWS